MAPHPKPPDRGPVPGGPLVPRPSGPELRRPRLLQLLEPDRAAPLTAVVGAPGAGKSVLAAAGARAWPGDVAWVALGPHTANPVTFQRAVRRALGLDPTIMTADVLSTVQWRSSDGPMLLVLDDAHHLDPTIEVGLGSLVRAVRHHARVVVTGRSVPSGLAPQLVVDDADLRLRPDELDGLLAAAGIELDDRAWGRLASLAEGWAAGAHFLIDAMRRADRPAEVLSAPIASSTDLSEYLQLEVLESCTEDERRLLLETSVLDELSVQACERVAVPPVDVAALLGGLADRRLLVDRVGPSTWRCHALLRRYLRAELERMDPARARRAHRTAATFEAASGRSTVAVDHLIDAFDHHGALALALVGAANRLDVSDDPWLRKWVSALSAHDDWSAAELLDLAHLARLAGELDECAAALHRAAAHGAVTSDMDAGWAQWRLQLGDIDEGLAHAVRAGVDERGRASDDLIVMTVTARLCREDLAGARALLDGWRDRPSGSPWREESLRPATQALVEWWSGDLDAAKRLAAHALDSVIADIRHPAVLAARFVVAAVDGEAGAATARRALRELALDAEDGGWRVFSVLARIELARQRRADRQLDLARLELDAARLIGDPHPLGGVLVDRIDSAEVQLLLAGRDGGRAAQLASGIAIKELREISLARCLVAAGDLTAASSALANVDRGTRRRRVESGLVELEARDDRPSGVDTLARSLLDDLGGSRFGLLVGECDDAVLGMLDRAARDALDRSTMTAVRRRIARLAEGALTDREMAVLEYLPTRLTVQSIADELYLSVNTVKSHLKRIYRKLDASSRDEAVARAVVLGLLRVDQPGDELTGDVRDGDDR
jgi:LuxR family maltose regulon positive regulatory protein